MVGIPFGMFFLACLLPVSSTVQSLCCSILHITGTTGYMAPDIHQGHPNGFKVDVWAVGVLVWELSLGCDPLKHGKTQQHRLQALKTGIVWK